MNRLLACSLAVLCASAASAGRDVPDTLPKLLWREPPESTMQAWKCGFAGCDHAPTPPFHFVKEDMQGSFPKLVVSDGNGRSWSVKFGAKATPESFSSRFVTALGYVVEPSYYIATGTLEGAARLHRARKMVEPDGSFGHARFQLRDPKELKFVANHAWSLADNPFRGSHEFAGLRVVMMLLSNWDAKDVRNGEEESNTGVFEAPGNGEPMLLYSFFDWGSTLGQWGGLMRRTRSDCSGFLADSSRFITGIQGNVIRWGYSGKHAEDVKAGITVDDLRWLAPYLARISDTGIRAGLKACGATDRQCSCWATGLEDRMRQVQDIASLGRLPRDPLNR